MTTYKIINKILPLVVIFLIYFNLNAQTKLAPLFSDHMVLQQSTDAAIWGTDIPKTKVIVKSSWGNEASTITNEDGQWKLFIKTEKHGGPYNIEVNGSEKIILKDVLLGEVWLCSGQSNMVMPMKGFFGQPVIGSNELLMKSYNPKLRLFNVKQNESVNPLKNCEGLWQQSTPETVSNFSAVAYIYGKTLQKNLDVPVGIICSAYGGTRVEAWTSKETLKSLETNFNIEIDTISHVNKNSPSVLYNAMIHPLIPYTIKGVTWYQGESNRRNANQYNTLFSAMIGSWREEWDIGDFPFYFVQIAPFGYDMKFNSAYLREAQTKTMLSTSNTGMVVTLDIGDEKYIHPPRKIEVATRLSYWALAKTYGIEGIGFCGPIYNSMEITDKKILINFDFAPNGLSSFGQELNDFTVAGKDKVFYPAKAEIKNGKLYVSCNEVENPVAVRYGWTDYFIGSLFNVAGLPASSFRTDDWED